VTATVAGGVFSCLEPADSPAQKKFTPAGGFRRAVALYAMTVQRALSQSAAQLSLRTNTYQRKETRNHVESTRTETASGATARSGHRGAIQTVERQ
jgi:hypothetical protein